MTGSITYLVDCASYQGSPDWARVAATCGGGAEKVTEGTSYVNPRWTAAKPQMAALGRHGFVPLAYMFLDASASGTDQARHFASAAGDLTGFGIVIDFERAPDGSPSRQQAVDAAAQVRKDYPRHPVGGYCPHWYTGGMDLRFADWLWASEYVGGSGDPAMLYAGVPAAWWAPYGGRSPALLQFTASASVAGITGPVDCSAFHGAPAALAALVLPASPVPPAPPLPGTAGSGLVPLPAGGAPVAIPVQSPARPGGALMLAGDDGAVVKVSFYSPGALQDLTVALRAGIAQPVVPRAGWEHVTVARLQRLDAKQSCAASAFCAW